MMKKAPTFGKANDTFLIGLCAFANKAVELRFVFKSDPAFTLKGITITNLMLAPE